MNVELNAKLMEAAEAAFKMYQHDMAKTILLGVAEIERLHQVLHDQGQRSAEVAKSMLTVLPLLRRIEQPTEEMLAAMSQDETPFICRRKIDKSGYEVARMDNEDWRECISEEQTVVFEGSEDTCEAVFLSVARRWRYGEMLRVANEQAIHGQPT